VVLMDSQTAPLRCARHPPADQALVPLLHHPLRMVDHAGRLAEDLEILASHRHGRSATSTTSICPSKRANTAVAHKLARMVYFMLTRGEDYVDQGQQHYEEQQRQRSIAALRRRAADLGFAITPNAATA
jgi:hypothetical protein